jgi:hypothetical protein
LLAVCAHIFGHIFGFGCIGVYNKHIHVLPSVARVISKKSGWKHIFLKNITARANVPKSLKKDIFFNFKKR